MKFLKPPSLGHINRFKFFSNGIMSLSFEAVAAHYTTPIIKYLSRVKFFI